MIRGISLCDVANKSAAADAEDWVYAAGWVIASSPRIVIDDIDAVVSHVWY